MTFILLECHSEFTFIEKYTSIYKKDKLFVICFCRTTQDHGVFFFQFYFKPILEILNSF